MESHRLMLISLLPLIFTFLKPINSYAHAGQNSDSLRENSLAGVAWALQFQVSDYLTVRPFQGSVVSIKHHYSPNVAFRLGASISLSNSTSDRADEKMRADTTYSLDDYSSGRNSQTFQLFPQFVYYIDPDSKINLFLGGGPTIKYSRSYRE